MKLSFIDWVVKERILFNVEEYVVDLIFFVVLSIGVCGVM